MPCSSSQIKVPPSKPNARMRPLHVPREGEGRAAGRGGSHTETAGGSDCQTASFSPTGELGVLEQLGLVEVLAHPRFTARLTEPPRDPAIGLAQRSMAQVRSDVGSVPGSWSFAVASWLVQGGGGVKTKGVDPLSWEHGWKFLLQGSRVRFSHSRPSGAWPGALKLTDTSIATGASDTLGQRLLNLFIPFPPVSLHNHTPVTPLFYPRSPPPRITLVTPAPESPLTLFLSHASFPPRTTLS